MAGSSVTFTESLLGPVKKLKIVWVSDSATGAASGTSTYAYNGKIELLTTVPDGGGTAPSDNYDITLKDSDNVDVLAGGGADRDTANTEQVLGTSLGAVAGSLLTFAVATAGNSKGGTAYVYIR